MIIKFQEKNNYNKIEKYIIKKYFNKNNKKTKYIKSKIGDDCAVVNCQSNYLVITTDTLVLNTHFLKNTCPFNLGYKSVSVNLSDLASMGASPKWFMLALTVPYINEAWISKYSKGLFYHLNTFNVKLIGGDLNKGPLNINITAHGIIPKNTHIKMSRYNAKIKDLIYVTGTLGDSAAGLAILMNHLDINSIYSKKYLISRHTRPKPRVREGIILRNVANASCDISDGMIMDLKNILHCSQCGAKIYLKNIPISSHLSNNVEYGKAMSYALYGGEDYELCFTIPVTKKQELKNLLHKTGTILTCIGEICTKKTGLQLIGEYPKIENKNLIYQHF
ncbi:MAG: thiamine-phosphate kinase [Wigglesworthia glossinidia]|nr:thiamine-phosphate kinase [Wigglesworthia glossinidia]